MKKTILITLATVFVSMVLFPGLAFSQGCGYDEYEYYDDYEDSYADYEYRSGRHGLVSFRFRPLNIQGEACLSSRSADGQLG